MDDTIKLDTLNLWRPELEKANFSILFPKSLPKDLKLQEASFRTENPTRDYPRCSLKLVFGVEEIGRQISIKEFNYDWSPAACDCPSLWKNHKDFATVDTPMPQPHMIGSDVLWVGFNYRNQRAASIITERTTVEIVVMKGELSDKELVQIAQSLKPLNSDQRDGILAKDIAQISYGYPKTVKAVNVPISFWSFPVGGSKIKYQTAFSPQDVPVVAKSAHYPLQKASGYNLVTVFAYHEEANPTANSRYNFVYEHNVHKGSTIQIQHVYKDSPAACKFPPEPDTTQKFLTTTTKIQGIDCHYAYRSEECGPFEVVFEHKDYRYLMLVKPTSWTNKQWLFEFLDSYLAKIK